MHSYQIADQFDIRVTHFTPLHGHNLWHGAKITATAHTEFCTNRRPLYLFLSLICRERLSLPKHSCSPNKSGTSVFIGLSGLPLGKLG